MTSYLNRRQASQDAVDKRYQAELARKCTIFREWVAGATYREAGEKFGISTSRAGQIIRQILRQLWIFHRKGLNADTASMALEGICVEWVEETNEVHSHCSLSLCVPGGVKRRIRDYCYPSPDEVVTLGEMVIMANNAEPDKIAKHQRIRKRMGFPGLWMVIPVGLEPTTG